MPTAIVRLGTTTRRIERFAKNSSAAAYLPTGIVRLGTTTCRIERFAKNSSAAAYLPTGIVRLGTTTCSVERFADNTSCTAHRKRWIVGAVPANRPRRPPGVCRCQTSNNHQQQDCEFNKATPETK